MRYIWFLLRVRFPFLLPAVPAVMVGALVVMYGRPYATDQEDLYVLTGVAVAVGLVILLPLSARNMDLAREVRDERRRIMEEAVQQLPVKLGEVVRLRHVEERSVREIARTLQLSTSEVRRRLEAGRQAVDEVLEARSEES